MDNLKTSIDRAQKLLKTPNNHEKYISIKIKPKQDFSCCFHSWPHTWQEINFVISKYGSIENEGDDVVIGEGEDKFVLECHESGPEIVVYVPIGIAALTLITNIINLIINIIKNRQKEKIGSKFIITKRIIRKSNVIEEKLIEIDFPLSDENVKLLNDKIHGILK